MGNIEEYQFVDFEDKLVKEDAYQFILDSCDEVEFFSEYNIGLLELLQKINAPTYPHIVDSLIEEREDLSWGMNGTIYKFKLDDYMKSILKKTGITNFLYLDNENKFLLQNTTLIKDNKIMYSSCTHEDFDELDEDFRTQLANICKDKLCSSNIYIQLKEKNKILSKEELETNIQILQDLCGYINQEINAYIYSLPENTNITLSNYIDIAIMSLSSTTSNNLSNIHSFKDFINQDFKFTRELQGKTINNCVNPSDLTPLANDILSECKYLYALINFEK